MKNGGEGDLAKIREGRQSRWEKWWAGKIWGGGLFCKKERDLAKNLGGKSRRKEWRERGGWEKVQKVKNGNFYEKRRGGRLS